MHFNLFTVSDFFLDKHISESKREPSLGVNKVILPTVPKSIRTPDIDMSKVPTKAPFKAYLSNLPYDITEEEISKFFRRLKVCNLLLTL